MQSAPVHLGRHVIVGSGSVVLPGTQFGDGAALGALSLAHGKYEAFGIFAGVPARRVGDRQRGLLRRNVTTQRSFKMRMSSPRDKHFAYGSQLYGSGLLILLLPAYFTRLGAEQFALMMMFFVAQGWIQISDSGFPLALSREIAATNREHQPSKIGSMLTALQLPMLPGMALVGVAMVGFCEWIARRGSEGVFDDAGTASLAIVFAALSLSLRWGSELYRAALAGAEQFVGLAALNIFSATARLGGALAILIYTGEDLFAWLICQAALSVVEMLVLVLLCRQKLGLRFRGNHGESTTVLRALRPMALQIAVASATWISITQLDKLILSQTLSLREYGAIGIASAIPVGLLTLAIPLLQLSYPALVRLHVAESRREQTALYLSLTAATCCLLFPRRWSVSPFLKNC